MSILLNKYGLLRIAAVSPDLKIADPVYNTEKIKEVVNDAIKEDCRFILFPELSLTGFSSADLLFQKTLRDKVIQSLADLKYFSREAGVTMIVGAPLQSSGKLFNCAVVISSGSIRGIVTKTYMSNSNEFYEERWFSCDKDRNADMLFIDGEAVPFGADLLFKFIGLDDSMFGIEICEDLWAVKPPSLDMAGAGANLILNLSAGNEILGKVNYRRQLVVSQSARCICAYVYAGAGPGESSTDIVFSGHSIIAENGKMLAETPRFDFNSSIVYRDVDLEALNNSRVRNNSFAAVSQEKDYRIIDVYSDNSESEKLLRDIPKNPFIPEKPEKLIEVCNELYNIQITGLSRRLRHIGSNNVVIGISGGLDSTLALLVAYGAFKKLGLDFKGIHAISMPGLATGKRTKSNAEKLAAHMGVSFKIIAIDKAVEQHFRDIGQKQDNYDVVYENSQARERTQILMDFANRVSGIVIGTGDLSELALGWCTYNGDQMSNYSVNSGIPKTLVRKMIEWYAGECDKEITKVLNDICDTPISPELIPGASEDSFQETEKSIGPYELHDFFLYYFHRYNFSPKKIFLLASQAHDKYSAEAIVKYMKIFYSRFFSQQFKRSCMPDGIKTGSVDLSPRGDWRMPSDAVSRIWIDEIKELESEISGK